MTETAVVAADVRKEYGDVVALDGVSLEIRTGEVFGLLGPNGAGKTTLVRAITGTVGVDRGDLAVFGTPPDDLDRSRLGVLPQEFAPPDRLTARELVEYYAGLYPDPRNPGSVLATVGMAEDADVRYDRLSGGQRRRTCLGIALVPDPDLLVLDEPTAGIDPAGRRRIRDRVADLAAGGTTVLVTGHDVSEIEHLSDRVGLLSDGELVAVGSPGDLVREHGGESRLLVETDAEPPTLDGREVRAVEDGFAVAGISPGDLGDLVEALDAEGVEYESLRWARPGLEDVYLRLTGTPELAGAVGGDDLNRAVAVAGETPGSDPPGGQSPGDGPPDDPSGLDSPDDAGSEPGDEPPDDAGSEPGDQSPGNPGSVTGGDPR